MEVKDATLSHLFKKKSLALGFNSIPFSQMETCMGHAWPIFDHADEDNGIEDDRTIRWKNWDP